MLAKPGTNIVFSMNGLQSFGIESPVVKIKRIAGNFRRSSPQASPSMDRKEQAEDKQKEVTTATDLLPRVQPPTLEELIIGPSAVYTLKSDGSGSNPKALQSKKLVIFLRQLMFQSKQDL